MMHRSRRSCKEIQLRIIVHLSKYNNVGVDDLWEYMRTNWNTMQDALEALKRHQIITIEPHDSNAGKLKDVITLTDKGKGLVYPAEQLLT